MAFFRHDKTDPNASQKPLQVGTKLFVEELSKRFFSASDDIIMMVIFVFIDFECFEFKFQILNLALFLRSKFLLI